MVARRAISGGRKVLIGVIAVALVLGSGTVLVAMSSQNNTSSGTSSTTTTAADGTPTVQSSQSSSATVTNSNIAPNGLQLQVNVHPTMVGQGTSGPFATVSLFNTLTGNVSVIPGSQPNSTLARWDSYDFLCGANPLWSLAGYALFSGYYASNNISSAGDPLSLAQSSAAIPCAFIPQPNSVVFLPQSDRVVTSSEPSGTTSQAYVNVTTAGCTGTEYSGRCGGSGMLAGYYNSTGSFEPFPLGQYTLVAEDAWGQTVFAHFQVLSAIGNPVDVVAVIGPIPPYNPGGPVVSVTLLNINASSIVSLNATLHAGEIPPSQVVYRYVFDVSSSHPLPTGRSVTQTLTLINGGFNTGEAYLLAINGTLSNGARFSYDAQVQISPPSLATPSQPSALKLNLNLSEAVTNPGSASPGYAIDVNVSEFNTLSTYNHITAAQGWPNANLSLGPCGTFQFPFGIVLYQGYYTNQNVSSGTPLTIYTPNANTTSAPRPEDCPAKPDVFSYDFAPQSNNAAVNLTWAGDTTATMYSMSDSVSVVGYWSGSTGSSAEQFHSLSPGVYTVLAGDEWGNMVLEYIAIK